MSSEPATLPTPVEEAPTDPPTKVYQRWWDEIDLADKEFKTWRERVRKVLQRYIDDRGDSPEASTTTRTAKFNILWSVVQTNSPAYYLRTPKCTVDRRYKDADPLSRASSQILERVTQTQLTLDQNFHNAMKAAVLDFQLAARGCSWVRYVPAFDPNDKDNIAWETAPVDYIHWEDFLHNAARTWAEVRWVGRRHYFTRAQCVSMFGEKIGRKIQLDYTPKALGNKTAAPNTPEHEFFAKATVWEIWDKDSRKRLWIAKGYTEGPAKEEADPLELDNFFPCPKPLYGTTTTDSLVPVPDYTLWQDQASEIDRLTTRIDRIVRAIKVAGAYDTAFPELARILQDTVDGDLIPIQNWVKFAEAGGFKGSSDYLQIDQYVKALMALVEARAQAKNDLYEITGQADIIRGSSNANETATAQRIKGQFATLRLQERQAEVQRFARDTVELVAEIVATKFQPQTLAMMAGVDVASDPEIAQMFPQAVALLKNDMKRTFRIDIETDSMIAIDQQADKQDATELVTSVGTYIEKALPAVQMAPALGPMLAQILLFAVRRFRAGRDLESTMEQGLKQLEQQAQQPQQAPPPSPEAQAIQAKAQAEQQAFGLDEQRKTAEHQRTMEIKGVDLAVAQHNAMAKTAPQPQEQPEPVDPLDQEGKQLDNDAKRAAAEKLRAETDQVGAQSRETTNSSDAVQIAAETAQQTADAMRQMGEQFGQALAQLTQAVAALTESSRRQADAAEAPTVLEIGPNGRKQGRKELPKRNGGMVN